MFHYCPANAFYGFNQNSFYHLTLRCIYGAPRFQVVRRIYARISLSEPWRMTHVLRCRSCSPNCLELLAASRIHACVRRYGGDRRLRGFSCRDQFLCLAFAQLTFRESLRDIETCLTFRSRQALPCGFRGTISRSTLADANCAHDWRIYADFAQVLIGAARPLYASDPASACISIRPCVHLTRPPSIWLTEAVSNSRVE